MKNYCTLSDKKYLKQGLALIRSLKKVTPESQIITQVPIPPYTFYYLCMDDETYEALEGEDVVRIRLSEVEKSRPEILEYKNKKAYNEYCWSLASTFCRFLLERKMLTNILYIDSDIYFYQDPAIIYDELGQKSIGIIRHRHNTSFSPDGEYNVGIIYFKNDEDGLSCLKWWNDCILKESRPELATCGDQKYLEEFVPVWGDSVCVLDKTFAHGAPWNFRLYVYDNYFTNGTVIWGDKEQPLVFNHFSKFRIDSENTIDPFSGQYADHTLNFQVLNIAEVKHFYMEYSKEFLN
tara:strand:+ start:2720 stop:3598 length:879 start_codon:yes stop_codon:yes gene_type:complete